MFCPNCDSVLVPIREKDVPKGALKCMDCDYTSLDENNIETFIIKDEISEEERSQIEVIETPVDPSGVPEEMREELREQYREALENFDL